MLGELRIRSLGVIEDAVLAFSPGLNVLTGETGAGKTMVVSGLGLLFGARADPGLVRAPATRASVEGFLDLPVEAPAAQRAAEAGADVEDGLILIRSVAAEGRSRAHAGGRSVPVGLLAELAQDLVVVHGQADQWRLRSAEEHRNLLDAFGGPPLATTASAYRTAYAAWLAAGAETVRLRTLAAVRAADLEALRAGVDRIEAVDPQPGEDLALRAEDDRLSHADQLRAAAGAAANALLGDDAADQPAPGATAALAAAHHHLVGLEEHDPALGAIQARLRELGILASELGAELSAYADGVDLDTGRLAAVQERRAELAVLSRAYGGPDGSVEGVLAWLAEASERLYAVDTAQDRLVAAAGREAELRRALADVAADLTTARLAAAADLAAAVDEELTHLAMAAARVTVAVTRRSSGAADGGRETVFGPSGADDVEFLLQANPGIPARPIAKAASGGELSRVMLALEVVLGARVRSVPTYVFDEVDAGVGGRAALDIGARLARLAIGAQVIVVTHLPQVAAFADRHLLVTKASDGGISRSDVIVLDPDQREREIARMMAGSDSSVARTHARELLGDAAAMKRTWDD